MSQRVSKRSRDIRRRNEGKRPAAATASASSGSWRPLLAVFLLALLIRVILAVEVWDLPIVRTPRLDSAEYVSWARRLAAGDFAWPIVSQHGPGYPFFLAGLLVIGGGSVQTALFAQAVLGAATAVLVAAVAREWLGVRAGLLAGLVYGLYGPAAYVDTAFTRGAPHSGSVPVGIPSTPKRHEPVSPIRPRRIAITSQRPSSRSASIRLPS